MTKNKPVNICYVCSIITSERTELESTGFEAKLNCNEDALGTCCERNTNALQTIAYTLQTCYGYIAKKLQRIASALQIQFHGRIPAR